MLILLAFYSNWLNFANCLFVFLISLACSSAQQAWACVTGFAPEQHRCRINVVWQVGCLSLITLTMGELKRLKRRTSETTSVSWPVRAALGLSPQRKPKQVCTTMGSIQRKSMQAHREIWKSNKLAFFMGGLLGVQIQCWLGNRLWTFKNRLHRCAGSGCMRWSGFHRSNTAISGLLLGAKEVMIAVAVVNVVQALSWYAGSETGWTDTGHKWQYMAMRSKSSFTLQQNAGSGTGSTSQVEERCRISQGTPNMNLIQKFPHI